ncbi:MAG: hypothetical protein ACRYE8_03595 [Janthinobacterium lividum]
MSKDPESKKNAQKEAKKMQQNSIKPLIDIIDNANLQNPDQVEELKKVQTQLANCFKENKLAVHNKLDQYLESKASQDRQEVMKDSKLPFKDKIYKIIGKMSVALGISSLKNYCQKKLDEYAVQRQEKRGIIDKKSHVEKLKESTVKRGNKVNER